MDIHHPDIKEALKQEGTTTNSARTADITGAYIVDGRDDLREVLEEATAENRVPVFPTRQPAPLRHL